MTGRFSSMYQQLLVTASESARRIGLERPDHADLVEPDAEHPRARLVDAELSHGFAHVEIGLARRHDAECTTLAVEDDSIQVVGTRERFAPRAT